MLLTTMVKENEIFQNDTVLKYRIIGYVIMFINLTWIWINWFCVWNGFPISIYDVWHIVHHTVYHSATKLVMRGWENTKMVVAIQSP